jgi:2-oxoglutarate dehydrogenase complex dehydrogenase (E1) component-like enzyme
MTEQSSNSQFRAQSYLDGANADYIDQMAAKHAQDPASVDASWARQTAWPKQPQPGHPGRGPIGHRSLPMI